MYELHGSIQTAACPACGARYDLPYLLEREVPECTATGKDGEICGTVLKTDVVLFGDAVLHFDTLYENWNKQIFYWSSARLSRLLRRGLCLRTQAGFPA